MGVSQLVFALSVFISLWAIVNYYYNIEFSFGTSLLINRLVFTFTSPLLAIIVHLALIFPQGRKLKLSEQFLVYGILLILIPLSLTPFIVKNIEIVGGIVRPIFNWGAVFFASVTFINVTYASREFIQRYRRSDKQSKRQLKFFVIGLMTTAFTSSITNLILPMFFGVFDYTELGPVSSIFFIVLTVYSILKYKLFDIRIIIGRILYYSVVAFIFFITFYGVIVFHNKMWGGVFTTGAYISGAIISIFYVYFINWFNTFIREKVDISFINPGFDPQEALTRYSNKLSTVLDIDEIFDISLDTLSKTVRPDYESIFIKTKKGYKIIDKKMRKVFDKEEISKAFTVWENVGRYPIDLSRFEDRIPYNFSNMSNWLKPILKQMKLAGIRALVPIGEKESIHGMIMVGSKSSDVAYTSVELNFMQQMANLLYTAMERAELHHEVQELNESLQQKVDVATEELRDKVAALEEARRKERDMLDILGHELRTPLTIVRNALSMMRTFKEMNTLTDEKFEEYVEMALENATREVQLLETMLTTTKIDNHALNLTLVKVDLNTVVRDSLRALQHEAEDRGLYVHVHNDPKAFVFVDRNRFQEVVDNLVSNAIKYTHKGGVDIMIETKAKKVILKITDTGVGIPKDQLKNLGKKFYRINTYLESSKKIGVDIVRPGGTGLGLYVTFQLVKAMKGKVEVESEVNLGSVFTITLPLYDGQDTEHVGEKKKSTFEKFEDLKNSKK